MTAATMANTSTDQGDTELRYRVRIEMPHPEHRCVPFHILSTLLRLGNTFPSEVGELLRQPLTNLSLDGEVEFDLTPQERDTILAWWEHSLWWDALRYAFNVHHSGLFALVITKIQQTEPQAVTEPLSDIDLEKQERREFHRQSN